MRLLPMPVLTVTALTIAGLILLSLLAVDAIGHNAFPWKIAAVVGVATAVNIVAVLWWLFRKSRP